MRRPNILVSIGAVGLIAFSFGCGGETAGRLDVSIDASEHAAMGDRAVVLGTIAPDSTTAAAFSETRVYGYVLEAKYGAKISIDLDAVAGVGGSRPVGSALDTILSVYGPMDGVRPGPLVATAEDQGGDASAPTLTLTIEEEGRYLIAFASWDNPGAANYSLTTACDGTDFQCLRPDWSRPCNAGTVFVQGGEVNTDTRWDTCEVVLLETTTVASGIVLTVAPGVTVKGNFLGTGTYGTVKLVVEGTLHAVGTATKPIAFTSFLPEQGWGGIDLAGPGNVISHAFVERANTGVRLVATAGATLNDVVIQGMDGQSQRGNGLMVLSAASADIKNSLLKNLQNAVYAYTSGEVTVDNSVIRNNGTGVFVRGEGGASSCRGFTPSVWRDPVITHTDIFNNGLGIDVNGSDLLIQVSESNLVGNTGYGFQLRGSNLQEGSHLRQCNIHNNNGTSEDVRSFHNQGELDLSGNYWVHISDPELSASFRRICSGGSIAFTGFSPVPIPNAGPDASALVPLIAQQTLAASGS